MNQDELLKCLVHGIKPGELYPESVRQFSLAINFRSPAAYNVVRNAFKKKLPHPHTIASWYRYSNIKSEPGFHQETCERLKKIASDVLSETKNPLVCSLIVDEMYIRKQVLWCNQSQKYVGCISYGAKEEQKLLPIANQAIVFLLNGINQEFEFPVGYHFIKSLSSDDKADLYLEVIKKVTDCGVVIKILLLTDCQVILLCVKSLEPTWIFFPAISNLLFLTHSTKAKYLLFLTIAMQKS